MFGLLFFTVIEIIQFKKKESKGFLGLGSSETSYELSLESVDNTEISVLHRWVYQSPDSNAFLDWFALHWPTIQHSVSILGGYLVFYYFKKDMRYYLNNIRNL
jgi:hypothetical protein